MEPNCSSPHLQVPATCPYPEPAQICYLSLSWASSDPLPVPILSQLRSATCPYPEPAQIRKAVVGFWKFTEGTFCSSHIYTLYASCMHTAYWTMHFVCWHRYAGADISNQWICTSVILSTCLHGQHWYLIFIFTLPSIFGTVALHREGADFRVCSNNETPGIAVLGCDPRQSGCSVHLYYQFAPSSKRNACWL